MANTLIIGTFVALALLAALSAAFLPWNLVLAFSIIPIFIGIAFAYPHYATILSVFLAFGAVPSFLLPQFNLAGGTVRASELFLLFVTMAAIFTAIKARTRDVDLISSPYNGPFLFFLLLVAISSAMAIGYFQNQIKFYLYELRVVFFWVIFPLILYSVRSIESTKKFVKFMLGMGMLLSIGVIFQSATGIQVLEASRVESLSTGGAVVDGVIRSTAGGGIYFILFLINYFLCSWAFNQTKSYIAWPIIAIGGLATLVTFGRAVWFAEAVAVLLLVALLPRTQSIKVAVFASLGGITLITSIFW